MSNLREQLRRLPVLPTFDGLGPQAPAPTSAPLRVGELAKLTGKTVRALHLYEELGLLEPASRTEAGYRMYSADSVTRVEWISHLQGAGLSLPEIRELLVSWGSSATAPEAMRKLTALYLQKLKDTRAQIEKLQVLEAELSRSLAYLMTCDTCEPKRVVSACPTCDRHECETHVPVLVAGLHPSIG